MRVIELSSMDGEVRDQLLTAVTQLAELRAKYAAQDSEAG